MNWPHRVVVTGCGVVSPVGKDTATYWTALSEGRSGIAQPTLVPPELLLREVVAEVKDYVPTAYFEERQLAPLDRVSQFAVIAAREALAQSGLEIGEALSERTAAIVGTGIGGATTLDESYKRLYADKATRVYPLTVPKLMPNAPASQVSMFLGLRGPSFGVVSACSSATHAIGLAYQMVRSGIADAAVTGGTEACINLGTLKGWEALRVMATDTCRPFSKGRKGLVIGEGAAMVVLETLDERQGARRRDHRRDRRLRHERRRQGPDQSGRRRHGAGDERLPRRCRPDRPTDVDYINAHGTGTLANDATETEALKVDLRRAGEGDSGLLDQVHGRPCAGRGRRAGIRRHASRHPRQYRAADDELSRARPGLRSRLRAQRSAADEDRRGDVELLRLRRPQRRAGGPASRLTPMRVRSQRSASH